MQNDLNKFLRSKGISSLRQDNHKKMVMSNSQFIIDDERNGMMVDIYAKLLEDRILFLTGEIDTYNTEMIKAQLLYLEHLDPSEDIKLMINSGGGDIYAGLGLIDTMEFIKCDIHTINTGLCASMASVLLASGTKGKRKALKRSRTMIHQPLMMGGYVQQATDIEIDAREINSLKKELYEILSDCTGQDYKKVYSDSERDYWMNAQETLKYGIIDEVITKRK